MIKFRIHPKILEGERYKFGKVLEKCQNYRFFDIFWDIFNKILPEKNWKNDILF